MMISIKLPGLLSGGDWYRFRRSKILGFAWMAA
jgi:hypothetical protein